ncbi:MAG TPA: hypothetical protein EYG13_07165, partial [Dehalococcoidia bacterium]|nr:hypothetical protein [Dehalococcoidia bacterium]
MRTEQWSIFTSSHRGRPMPELPEIEALRRYLLREGLVGRSFVEVDAEWPGVEDTIDGMGGLAPLVGRRIKAFGRQG